MRVFALYKDNWYRGKIIRIGNRGALVYLSDTGLEINLPTKDLRCRNELKYRSLSTKFSIQGLSLLNINRPIETLKKILALELVLVLSCLKK